MLLNLAGGTIIQPRQVVVISDVQFKLLEKKVFFSGKRHVLNEKDIKEPTIVINKTARIPQKKDQDQIHSVCEHIVIQI